MEAREQQMLAPVLASPVLKQLLVAMLNDPQQTTDQGVAGRQASLKTWLANPRVVQLLRTAAKALRKGGLTEEQLLTLLQQETKVPHCAVDLDPFLAVLCAATGGHLTIVTKHAVEMSTVYVQGTV